ncbi:hypothetical protein PoMZ_10384 [Pyricularia oryzae]|uniref:Uncharacterized protein n=1 Tax=Pyricularia oryzae TaxID=318829 RepID=A0A4V1C502_PYROR|nr:hypothetical protein PoMZ_10384 [Pyricularia oryzae]
MQALACVCPLGSLSLQREAGWCYPTIWPGSSATAPGFGGILGDIAHHVGGHGSNHTARFHALAPELVGMWTSWPPKLCAFVY